MIPITEQMNERINNPDYNIPRLLIRNDYGENILPLSVDFNSVTDKIFGGFPSNYLKITLDLNTLSEYFINAIKSEKVVDINFEVFFTYLDIENMNEYSTWVKFGEFNVTSLKDVIYDVRAKKVTLTVFDKAIKAQIKYEPINTPITVKEYIEEVGLRCDIPVDSSNIVGGDIVIEGINVNDYEVATYREMISQLGAFIGFSTYINHSGAMTFVDLSTPRTPIEVDIKAQSIDYDFFESTPLSFDTLVYDRESINDPIIYYYNKDIDPNAKDIEISEYRILDNRFVDFLDRESQIAWLDALAEKVDLNITCPYSVFSLDWFVQPNIQLYDTVKLKLGDKEITTIVNNLTSTWNGGWMGTISSEVYPNTKSRYDLSSKDMKELNMGITVDRINGEIVYLVENVEIINGDLSQQYSLITQNASSIEQEILDRQAMGNNLEQVISSNISQVKDEVNITFQEILQMIDGEGMTEFKTYFTFNTDGMEIGKNTSPFKMKLSNEKLAFVENGKEIAYMSGSNLYITDATILNSLTLGYHVVEKSPYNSNSTIIRMAK